MDLSDGKPDGAGSSDDTSEVDARSEDVSSARQQCDAPSAVSDDEFLQSYHWLVVRVVQEVLASVDGRSAPSDARDDLLADGWEGLTQARNNYDPTKASFKTYAEIKIRSAVKAGWLRLRGRRRGGQLQTVPLDTRIAEQVEAIRSTVVVEARAIVRAGELFCGSALAAEQDQLTTGSLDDALATLTPHERRVIEHKYYRDGDFKTLAAEFGISKFAISRLHDKVITRLHAFLTSPQERD